jgi:hypothetical protein
MPAKRIPVPLSFLSLPPVRQFGLHTNAFQTVPPGTV